MIDKNQFKGMVPNSLKEFGTMKYISIYYPQEISKWNSGTVHSNTTMGICLDVMSL